MARKRLPSIDDPDPVVAPIARAKLGRERQAAREDVCDVFAAALFDVLQASCPRG